MSETPKARSNEPGLGALEARRSARRHSVRLHVLAWIAVYAVELRLTRRFHPRLSIAALATAILVIASATAAYANLLHLWPRARARRAWGRYLAELAASIAASAGIAVIAIQGVYGLLWHPDPLRFGWAFNLASDAFVVGVHVMLLALFARLARR
jgi:hypothetical protein